MKEYFGKFETASQVQSALDADELSNPYVALVGGELDYNTKNKNTGPTPSSPDKYLTFEIIEGGEIYWCIPLGGSWGSSKTIQYSVNDGEWKSTTSQFFTTNSFYTAETGDVIRFRGQNSKYGDAGSFSGTTAVFKVSGNIMSLIDGFSLPFPTTFGGETNVFSRLFESCTGLTDAGSLLLPNDITDSCYANMFYNCTSLTTAPVLPATTLTYRCYYNMFNGCSSINCIKCLSTNISATECTNNWVNGVAATGTFFKNKNMEDWTTGDNGIPTGWTVVNVT